MRSRPAPNGFLRRGHQYPAQFANGAFAHGEESGGDTLAGKARRLPQGQGALETGQQHLELAVQFPFRESHRLETISELRIGLNGADRIGGSHSHQRNAEFVGQILQHIEKDPLFADVAGDDMMHLVDNQQPKAGGARYFEDLHLPSGGRFARPVRRSERIENARVKAVLLGDWRSLHRKDGNANAVAAGVIVGPDGAARSGSQWPSCRCWSRPPQVGGHTVQGWIEQQILQPPKDFPGARIPDPAGLTEAADAFFIR